MGPVAAKVAAARAGGKIVEAVARVREPSERPWDQNRVGYRFGSKQIVGTGHDYV